MQFRGGYAEENSSHRLARFPVSSLRQYQAKYVLGSLADVQEQWAGQDCGRGREARFEALALGVIAEKRQSAERDLRGGAEGWLTRQLEE